MCRNRTGAGEPLHQGKCDFAFPCSAWGAASCHGQQNLLDGPDAKLCRIVDGDRILGKSSRISSRLLQKQNGLLTRSCPTLFKAAFAMPPLMACIA